MFFNGKHRALKCTTNHIDSEFYDVVIKDNIDELQKIDGRLMVGDQRTPTNNTVLHLACQHGSINCVKQILRVHESLLLELNSRGETALHLAAREGHYDVVVALINAAKSLQNEGEPVHELIRKANLELETALHAAVRYNHKNVVEVLVSEDPSHKQPRNKHGETPMYLATIRCHTDIMETILNVCEFPTFDGPGGRTALHAAVLDGHCNGFECLKLLLKKKQYLVTEIDNYGWTVLHYVAFNDLYTVVEDIAGASKHVGYIRDREYGRTALHVAAYEGNVRVMEKLLNFFPGSWDIVNARDQNILHIAVERDKKEVIRFILSRDFKASNNLFIQRDEDGNTPLHLIAKLGCYVKELMDLKALDWEVLNDESFTPLDVLLAEHETVVQADQEMIRTILVNANVKKHRHLWRTLKEPDIDRASSGVKKNKIAQQFKEHREMISTHMIVAALIATVALTAGFAMPGGFDGNQGPTQGSPILVKSRAFKYFIIADTLALFLSVSSLSLFLITVQKVVEIAEMWFYLSVKLNIGSIFAMMLTFILGVYSVIDRSSSSKKLAVYFCLISSLALFILFLLISLMLLGLYLPESTRLNNISSREPKERRVNSPKEAKTKSSAGTYEGEQQV
ncbi:protein ACCELERATED CELL DEATH 6-like [Apium graveolens]|uniref:protein ACCELERATED CELL DEATH 6-like n=1 Tax=Apium graveolens TaxID=4045 RepID=UPI003D7955F7